MASTGRPVLGIDINQYEIRVVEMRGAGISSQVVRAGSVPLPPGAVEGDRITYPDVVAETLKGLIARMNVSTRAAVIGLGARSTIARVLDVPKVPDSELRMVVEGELAHYQILRDDTGTFDYCRLVGGGQMGDANPQVLLMAVEDKVASDYRDVCDRAGLNLVALEPIMLALYRTAYQQVQAQASAACLMVGHGKTEIAIVDHGQIRLYRRVDIGSDDLIAGRRPMAVAQEGDASRRPTLLSNEEELFEAAPQLTNQTQGILGGVAGNLATELQRSLDYYRREYPGAPSVTRTILSTNDPDLEPLVAWLGQALAIDVSLAEPPISIGVSRAIAAQLEETAGLRFVGACGLALHGLPGMPAAVPAFNLAAGPRLAAASTSVKSRFTVSMAASFVLLIAGLAFTMWMRSGVLKLESDLNERQARLSARQREQVALIQQVEGQRQILTQLKKDGFPLPAIMDTLTNKLANGSSLADLSLGPDGLVAISGEAASQMSMIQTLQGIQSCPQFVNTVIRAFNSKEINKQQFVEFKMTTQIASSLLNAAPMAPVTATP